MTLLELTQKITDFLWTTPAVVLLLGMGLYLTVVTRGVQFRKFSRSVKLLLADSTSDEKKKKGEVSSMQALSIALAGTVGAGNIAGVAAAITFGGPGAIFWMWVTAIVGMATTYSCCSLAVKYREKDAEGRYVGGPMYVLRNALKMPKLAAIFSVCAVFATLGSGNMIPANAMMQGVEYLFPTLMSYKLLFAVLFSASVGVVVVGGVKRIGLWMGRLVPMMCVLYLGGVFYILLMHIAEIPHAFYTIFNYALNPWAVGGGGIGYAIQYGVARGLFSNEAGQGSLPMIHALAKTDSAKKQGYLAMLGPFIDTIIVCTLTALVIIVMGLYGDGLPQDVKGSHVALMAFQRGIGLTGTWVVAIGLILFAYSTIVAWSYYGEAAIKYLMPDASETAILLYRCFYSVVVALGAMMQLELVWNICDIAMALMMLPNLISLFLLRKELSPPPEKKKTLFEERSYI